jgi:hypothetical protein
MCLRAVFLGLLTLGLSARAEAGICLKVDTERDNMGEQDRRGGMALLSSEVEDKGGVVGGDCETTWVVVHIKLGRSVTVSARSGEKTYKMTAEAVEDLPRVYAQLAHGIVTGEPLKNSIDRSNVTRGQSQGRRVKSEYMATVLFGGTAYPPAGALVAPTLGGGFRVEMDHWAIDATAKLAWPAGDPEGGHQFSAMQGHLNALRFGDPLAPSTWFYGGGLGYGLTYWQNGPDSGDGHGFEAGGIAGYELGRASTMRLFVQADLTVPLYSSESNFWSPYIGLSIGIAYKPPARSSILF